MNKKLIIVGGGPAGLSAAVAACDAGLSAKDILILERDTEPGGILNQCIHAGFGLHRFGEELSGPEYAGRYIKMVNDLGVEIATNCMVLNISENKLVTFVSPELGYNSVQAEAIILAMGCRERPRGALNIPGARPSGIFTAGTAQRYINIEGYMPGKKVVILGSGDIGLIMARRMTLEGAKVECVCEIMPYSGGLARNIEQCLNDFGIPLKLSHTVIDIKGKDRVEGVTIAAVDEANGRRPIKGTEQYIECDTLLLSCGLIPENELTRGANIAISPITNGAVVNQNRETSIKGIYACGNALHVHDLVDYVSEEAAIAGEKAAKQIMNSSSEASKSISIKTGFGVRYSVPQRIEKFDIVEPTRVYFRVTDIYKKVKLVISDTNGNVYVSKSKLGVAPGEMESLEISEEILNKLFENNITELELKLEMAGENK